MRVESFHIAQKQHQMRRDLSGHSVYLAHYYEHYFTINEYEMEEKRQTSLKNKEQVKNTKKKKFVFCLSKVKLRLHARRARRF